MNHVEAAKAGFEAAFAEGTFYDRQTQDAAHLNAILALLPVRAGMRILDLGTGSGYLAFALAAHDPDAAVTGLDIAEKTLAQNRVRAAREERSNLHFAAYDGIDFPFADSAFDMVVSRYSFHHFPDADHSIAEVSRVLTENGYFFLSDPAPNDCDSAGFADAYMRVKPDGHNRFYTKQDWLTLCGRHGFRLADSFCSSIRFPRKNAPVYQDILQRFDRAIAESYRVQIIGDEIYITEQVNNLLFCKNAAKEASA